LDVNNWWNTSFTKKKRSYRLYWICIYWSWERKVNKIPLQKVQ